MCISGWTSMPCGGMGAAPSPKIGPWYDTETETKEAIQSRKLETLGSDRELI